MSWIKEISYSGKCAVTNVENKHSFLGCRFLKKLAVTILKMILC